MKSLNFRLAEINRKATKLAVEKELEELRFQWYTEAPAHRPSVTASYSLTPSAPSNQFNSKVENAAIKNVDREAERRAYIEEMTDCINRLPELERAIIYKEVLDEDYRYNYEIFDELGISKSQFYVLKSSAYYKIAFILRLEVYMNREVVPS